MPGKGNMRMSCGRRSFCGRESCPHAVWCAQKSGVWDADKKATEKETRAPGRQRKELKKKLLAEPADVVYLYDGSQNGFFCCVYESVYTHELPAGIFSEGEAQPTLFQQKWIETDEQKAWRVKESISQKISPRAMELVNNIFLSCLEEKEIAMLRFLLLGYKEGGKTPWMMGHEDVAPLLEAEKHMMGEAHLLRGFVRFSDYDGVLAATITPKNFILPFLAGHFAARYPGEEFLIFDKTHKAALIYKKNKKEIVPIENIDFPVANETEEKYRSLWKQFYKTIAIEARENPRCRMTHMPKRYWENMLEVQDLL